MQIKLMGDNDYLFDPKKQIAVNRGLSSFDDLLATEEDINNPSLFKSIDDGVETLKEVIDKKGKIHIIVDSDADGNTSATVAYLFLTEELKYPKNLVSYSAHRNKEHGVILKELEGFNFDLLWVPDAGSSDVEQCKFFSEKGVDVLVTDHHIVEEFNPYAVVINSKDGVYPNSELSGVGVTYQFCKYYAEKNNIEIPKNKYLDLVATGLIADMVDSRVKENRFFMREGLNNVSNLFLKNLMAKNLYNKDTIITNISFYIAPTINAICRVGTLEEKLQLFEAFINDRSPINIQKRGKLPTMGYIADDMPRIATNIKARQDRERDKILEMLSEKINIDDPILMLEMPEDISRVYYGLIASNLSNKFGKPCIIYSANSHGSMSGSARGYELSGIEDFRAFLLDSGLFTGCFGHNNAFGSVFEPSNEPLIRDWLSLNAVSTGDKTYHVDFSLGEKDLNVSLISCLNNFIPHYGQNFKEPYVHVQKVLVNPKDVIINDKKSVLKFVKNGVTYCKFYPNEEMINLFTLSDKSFLIDVVGRCSINEYNGEKSYQMILDNYDFLCYNSSIVAEEDDNWF